MKTRQLSFKNNPSLLERLNSATKTLPAASNMPVSKREQSPHAVNNSKRKYAAYTFGALVLGGVSFAAFKGKNLAGLFENFFKNLFKNSAEKYRLKEKNATFPKAASELDKQIEVTLKETQEQALYVKKLTEEVLTAAKKEIEVNWKTAFENNDFVNAITTDNAYEAQRQVIATRLYSVLNIRTHDFKLLGSSRNPHGMYIQVFGSLKNTGEDVSCCKKISEDFAADAFAANRDVLNSCRLDKYNNIVRFDLTETLGYKKDGEKNYFGTVVEELSDFFDPEKFPENAKLYADFTRDDLIKSLEKFTKIGNKELKSYSVTDAMTDCGEFCEKQLCDIFLRRKNFISEFLAQAKNTPQNNEDMKTYTQHLKINTIKNLIKKSNDYATINDLRQSIYNTDNIHDPQTVKELKTLVDNKIHELSSTVDGKLSMFNVERLLQKYTRGNGLDEKENAKLNEKYGSYAGHIKRAINSAIDSAQIKEITQIVNMNDGKYIEFWENNPEKMALYINSQTTTAGQLKNFSPESWDFVIKNFKQLCENVFDKEAIDAAVYYAGMSGYDRINGILRCNYKADKLIKKLATEPFDSEAGMINFKNELEPLKYIINRLYIGKDFEQQCQNKQFALNLLDNILTMPDTPNNTAYKEQISDSLNKLKDFVNKIASECGLDKKIEALKNHASVSSKEDSRLILNRTESIFGLDSLEYNEETAASFLNRFNDNPFMKRKFVVYLNETQPVVYQPGFISTSIAPYKTLDGNVKWTLSLGENVKYNYINDIDHIFGNAGDGTEAEVLINPGHFIKITNAVNLGNELRLFGEILPGRLPM